MGRNDDGRPSLARWRMRSMTIWRLALSSEAVGSSAYNTSACLNMARAKPIGPNDVVSHHQTTPTRAPALPSSPTLLRAFSTSSIHLLCSYLLKTIKSGWMSCQIAFPQLGVALQLAAPTKRLREFV